MSDIGEPPFKLVVNRPISIEAKEWLEQVRQAMWTPELKEFKKKVDRSINDVLTATSCSDAPLEPPKPL